MRRLIVAVAAVALAGCAGKPGGNWIGANTPGDVGNLPDDYKGRSDGIIRAFLKDPAAAQITVGEGRSSSCEIGVYGTFYGWAVPVAYNGKNSFGGYVGYKGVLVWFADGSVQRISDDEHFCPVKNSLVD